MTEGNKQEEGSLRREKASLDDLWASIDRRKEELEKKIDEGIVQLDEYTLDDWLDVKAKIEDQILALGEEEEDSMLIRLERTADAEEVRKIRAKMEGLDTTLRSVEDAAAT